MSDLSAQIRAELADAAPAGLRFTDHVIRQDAALERMAAHLEAHPDRGEVDSALIDALAEERDGWALLKLLELIERLGVKGATSTLMSLAQNPPGDGPRARFLAGRACEVLLQLPLDYATRLQANEVSKGPLEEIARYRMGAQKERTQHRPRTAEWALLVVLMAIGVAGFVMTWMLKT
jgi:hypothetical protein